MRDFLNSPAFGLLVGAALQELRAWRRARQARGERQDFQREMAALYQQDAD